MIVKAYNISYDADDDKELVETLPQELIFSHFKSIDDVEEELADAISDETGFCIYSCEFKILK